MSTPLLSVSIDSPQINPISLFRQPDQPLKKPASQNKIIVRSRIPNAKADNVQPAIFRTGRAQTDVSKRASWTPRYIRSKASDRLAIFDQRTGSYIALSSVEEVSRPGLTREEADAWVDGQLVLLKNGMGIARMLQVVVMIAASWGCTILSMWGLFKLLF